ncbi:VWA domain-containing protein [Streptomyces sp. JNUCC 64]
MIADRFDRIAWHDTYAQSAGLRELAEELGRRHDCAVDLLTDAFLAAYTAGPWLRERAEMDLTRLVNHQVVTALVESPEFAGLRRETVGDPYAAAMAVLAQAATLRRILDGSRNAQERTERAKRARRAAGGAVTTAGPGLQGAADAGAGPQGAADADGGLQQAAGAGAGFQGADQAGGPGLQGTDQAGGAVPAPTAAGTAREAAEALDSAARQADLSAERALAAVAPGIRVAARHAAGKAAEAVRREAALMRTWGVGPGELERMPFERRARLAERLRTGRLARWADLIGRFRRMADAEHARATESPSGELVDVTLGDDLSRLIPSELVNLGVPELRAVFAARYAAGELMLYDSQAERPTGRGAVIACVDTSHSMYAAGPGGVTRETWAKACALALLDQARRTKRDFVGILFSSADRIRIFRFPAGQSADTTRTVEFAETFLGGGTSFQTPLTAAVELLAEEFDDTARLRGDIVLITDAECEVSGEWTRGWNDAKRRLGFRLFGVAVGAPRAAGADSVLAALCDDLRGIEDLTDVDAAAGLFRAL